MSVLILNRGIYVGLGYYKIKLYRYGELWKTLNIPKGGSVTLGACDAVYDDDTFYGWSLSPNNTTIKYTSRSSVTPTTDVELYAVFSYENPEVVEESIGGANPNQDVTITIPESGTVRLDNKIYISYQSIAGSSTPSNPNPERDADFNSTQTAPYYLYNGRIGTAKSFGVSKGNTIRIVMPAVNVDTSNNYGSGGYNIVYQPSCTIYLTYNKMIVKYRVESHS